MRLEDLTPGATVRGIFPDAAVSVVSVQWHGTDALTLVYRSPFGRVAEEILYRHDEARWPEPEWISGFDLAAGADLLIHDTQYTDEQYRRCIGWGHSSYRHAFEFAKLVRAKEFVTFHHDPSHDDNMLDRLLQEAMRKFQPECKVSAGQEGVVFEIGAARFALLRAGCPGDWFSNALPTVTKGDEGARPLLTGLAPPNPRLQAAVRRIRQSSPPR